MTTPEVHSDYDPKRPDEVLDWYEVEEVDACLEERDIRITEHEKWESRWAKKAERQRTRIHELEAEVQRLQEGGILTARSKHDDDS